MAQRLLAKLIEAYDFGILPIFRRLIFGHHVHWCLNRRIRFFWVCKPQAKFD